MEYGQPVVVKTIPEAGTKDVDPNVSEIQVTFSREMSDGDWSWVSESQSSYPTTTGEPKYLADKRTCVLPVKLEPGKTYAVWLNDKNYRSFNDTNGHSAASYLLVFQTKEAAGDNK